MNELPVISVTELVTAFKEVVETALPPCSVEGEVSNCRMSPAGHWYLTLKDETSEISAVIREIAAARIKFAPKDGMKVLATGSLQVYSARGTCQFVITKLMAQGIGELELAFRQLRDKLAAEGLFEDSETPDSPDPQTNRSGNESVKCCSSGHDSGHHASLAACENRHHSGACPGRRCCRRYCPGSA